MNCFLLLALASSCLAAPAPGQLPAGVSAYSCPNYPYCSGANTLSLAVPNVPGAADVIRAQEDMIRGNLAPTVHAAAEAAITQQSVGSLPAYPALEKAKAVLMPCNRFVYLIGSTMKSFNTSRLRLFFVLLSRCSLLLVFSFKDKNVISFAGASFFCQLEII